MSTFLRLRPEGLYCEPGRFYIDPWRGVERALVTHGHSDHARPGSKRYLTATPGTSIVAERVDGPVDGLPYGERRRIGDVDVSFHPAGHLFGSAQIRMDYRGEVCVVTGDYKRGADTTCQAFEPVRCHTLVTECTFGLPIYRWPSTERVREELHTWWAENLAAGRNSVVYAYSLGKAQRVLALCDPPQGPMLVHGAVDRFVQRYRELGVVLPPTEYASVEAANTHKGGALIIAPPSAAGSTWLKKFKPCSTAFASGWMLVRGVRRRRAADRGFVLSDHIDWPDLLRTIEESGAETVWATHGFTETLVAYLREQGKASEILETRFTPNLEDGEEA